MKPKFNERNIKSLFFREHPFEIPSYQRDYVWKEEEATDFLNDLVDTDKENPLFLGNIILHESGNKTKIVDGQQRITSILIFLIACRVFVQSKKFDPNLISRIQRNIVLSYDKVTPILSTNDELQPILEVMADQRWDGEYKDTMGTRHAWNKLAKPYKYFYKKIRDDYPEEENLKTLFDKILEILFMEITVNDEDEAISTFERVNARGQHLQVGDLLKAYLFSKEKDLKNIKETWKSIRKYAGSSHSKLKRVINLFYFSKKGYILPNKLYRSLKKEAEEGPNLETFVQELESFAEFYALVDGKPSDNFMRDAAKFIETDIGLSDTKIMEEDRIKQVAFSLFAIGLFKVSSVYPLLYSSLLSLKRECEKYENIIDKKEKAEKEKKPVDDWIDMLIFFEHFLFTRNRIAHNTSQQAGSLQKLYSDYCMKFAKNDGNFSENIQALKYQFTKTIKINENEFVESFKNISYSNKDDRLIIYYVFDKLNNTTTKGKTVNPADRNSLLYTKTYKEMAHNLEHLYPRSSNKDNQGEIDSIGNLLVLHKRHNSKLDTKPPKEKMEMIKGWIMDREIQNKPYLADFVKDYQHLFEQEEWNPVAEGGWNLTEIEKRTKDIAKRIYRITVKDK